MASERSPFGDLLKQHRVRAGLSQDELAERAGLSRRGISDLERGARRWPYPATARRLADALHLDAHERAGLLGAARALPSAASIVAGRWPSEPTAITTRADEVQLARFGQLLRRHRAAARMTQETLANRAGVSARALSDLERNLRQPDVRTVERMVEALGLNDRDRAAFEAAALHMPPLRHLQSTTADTVDGARPRHNLPVQLTSFIGRVREIKDIRQQLGKTRLLTLVGPGGVGKTRIALQVADLEVESFSEGVWFVDLAPLTEPALVPQIVASLFAVNEGPGEPLIATLGRALQRENLLLILDNCEHLIAACIELVSHLLRACPRIAILTTSREVLGISAESQWRVPPMRVAHARTLSWPEQLADVEAAGLFVERARAVQPAFAITPRNAAALLEVCRGLDGIPLAIELAASHVKVLGLEQMAQRLASDVSFLASKDPNTDPRQLTLEKTIQWSYDLLTSEEQALFDRLSVFAGGWSLAGLEAVAGGHGVENGNLIALLERLIDKSLVSSDDALDRPPRYRVLEPLRQFGQRCLECRGEADGAKECHAAYFLEFFERIEQDFLKKGPIGRIHLLDPEVDNLRIALRWLIGRRDHARAQRLAGAARQYWFYRGYMSEGRRWLTEALAVDSEPANLKPQHRRLARTALKPGATCSLSAEDTNRLTVRSKVLMGIAQFAVHQADLDGADKAARCSLDLDRRLGNTSGVAWALAQLAAVAKLRGKFDVARTQVGKSIAAAQKSEQLALIPGGVLTLAELDLEDGRATKARERAEEGLRLAISGGFAPMVCRASTIIGELYCQQGQHQTARLLWEEALDRVRQTHQRHVYMVPVLLNLARLAEEYGDTDRARLLLRDALTLAQEVSQWEFARCLEAVVELATTKGHSSPAICVAGAAANLRDAMGTPLWPSERRRLDSALVRARRNLTAAQAEAAWLRGSTSNADEILTLALDLLRQPSAESVSGSPSPVPAL
jgi:non-specific serine/threonine protein kinase